MTAEYDGDEVEYKDRTKMVWAGIAVTFAVMVGALWFSGRPDPDLSMVRVKHILIMFDAKDMVERQRALEKITELRERLVAGESFKKLAKEYSDDPGSKARGGEMGLRNPDDYEGPFKDYVLSAPVNELSHVVTTTMGFHLIMVTERRLSAYDQRELDLERRLREEDETKAGGASDTAPVL